MCEAGSKMATIKSQWRAKAVGDMDLNIDINQITEFTPCWFMIAFPFFSE